MKQIEKIKIALIFSLLALGIVACSSKKSIESKDTYSDVEGKTFEESGMEFYTCISGTSPNMRSYLKEKNIKRAILVGGHFIEDDSEFTVNKDRIDIFLDKKIPNRESDAMIVLDFEGQKMTDLSRTSDEAVAARIVNHYIGVFKYFKKQRPNAIIGYYGYPFRDYWNRNEKWRKKNDLLIPLFAEVDALFPSIYDFYADDIDVKKASDLAYVRENVEETLRLAKGKPVYPFVWHRYHSSNKKRGKDLIDLQEFEDHVASVATASYDGHQAAGVVWWSSEQFFYNLSNRGKVNKRNSRDFDDFSDEFNMPYIDTIINGLKKRKGEAVQK